MSSKHVVGTGRGIDHLTLAADIAAKVKNGKAPKGAWARGKATARATRTHDGKKFEAEMPFEYLQITGVKALGALDEAFVTYLVNYALYQLAYRDALPHARTALEAKLPASARKAAGKTPRKAADVTSF